MNDYDWSSAYLAAIEEHDRVELQQRIGEARKAMAERIVSLVGHLTTDGDKEEYRQLCDARRTLDLLERVSNGLDSIVPAGLRNSA